MNGRANLPNTVLAGAFKFHVDGINLNRLELFEPPAKGALQSEERESRLDQVPGLECAQRLGSKCWRASIAGMAHHDSQT